MFGYTEPGLNAPALIFPSKYGWALVGSNH